MNEKKLRVAKPVLVAATLASILWVSAGSLTPPPGPITSTMKDLATVEPRTPISAATTPGDADSLFMITQPGSYYLTGNITGVVGKHGVEIAASGVTLDLNGFDLVGAPAMGAFDGVNVPGGGLTNITVVHGSVRNWGDKGVDLFLVVSNCRVEGVLASGNVADGISVGAGSTVTNCSAYNNTGNGILTDYGCTLSNCSAYRNAVNGISAGPGNTLSNCSAYNNTGNGIFANSISTLSNCSSYLNVGIGISTSSGCTVADCAASFNQLDGIRCSSQCIIRGNACSYNAFSASDGAGIHATLDENRIEGNNCTGSDRGIDVDSAGNFITRNTCSGNSINWDVVAGNVIFVVNAATAGAVSGNSGGVAPGSTDPNANFSY